MQLSMKQSEVSVFWHNEFVRDAVDEVNSYVMEQLVAKD